MKLIQLNSLILLILLSIGSADASVTEDDFVAMKTQNIINLCTASPKDRLYEEAIHFCQGYLVGAFHFYTAQAADKPELQLVCYPEPKPSRNDAIGMFVAWVKQHPEFMDELPVETEFRFLSETWPCKK